MVARDQRLGMALLADGGRVAYALTGTGPFLLVAPGWLSHLELGWAIPAERVFHESLSSGRTLVRYDRPGCGLSDAYEGPRSMGLRQAGWAAPRDTDTTTGVRVGGLHGLVRHPLMTGLVLAFWATPQMGASHLFFALAATGYIAIGIAFEERDLRRAFGTSYDDYAARVPALVPRLPFRRGPRRHLDRIAPAGAGCWDATTRNSLPVHRPPRQPLPGDRDVRR